MLFAKTSKKKIPIVSGYFNPTHCGHLDMIEEASKIGPVLVIVNNDKQQKLKKGKIIIEQEERIRLVEALRDVNMALLSVDKDETVIETLKKIGKLNEEEGEQVKLVFCNGGDRRIQKDIPEAKICKQYGIEMRFGIGGKKTNSSTEINKKRGLE